MFFYYIYGLFVFIIIRHWRGDRKVPGKDRAAGLAKDRMRRESNSGHHERTSVICQRTNNQLIGADYYTYC